MPRFTFTLQALLTSRLADERVKQRRVAEIQREMAALGALLRRQQDQVESGREAMREGLTGTLDPNDLRLQAGATMHQLRTAQRMIPQLAALHQQLDAARAELVEASRQRRAIELLKEKRLEAWKKEQGRVEMAALDEMAVGRAARESRGERKRQSD
jgi:flagellar FliJ protein